MNPQEIENAIALNKNDRYNYSIREIIKHEAIWVASTDVHLTTVIDNYGNEVWPIWPHKEVAESFVINEIKLEGIYMDSIDYDTFKTVCIPDMISNNVLFGVFYSTREAGVLISGEDLLKDLIKEEENR